MLGHYLLINSHVTVKTENIKNVFFFKKKSHQIYGIISKEYFQNCVAATLI